jgi:hypothetical protein
VRRGSLQLGLQRHTVSPSTIDTADKALLFNSDRGWEGKEGGGGGGGKKMGVQCGWGGGGGGGGGK